MSNQTYIAKPVHEHDCSGCIFLGSQVFKGRLADLWICPQEIGGVSVIARWSSEGSDYASMPVSMVKRIGEESYYGELMMEIVRRAELAGHLGG